MGPGAMNCQFHMNKIRTQNRVAAIIVFWNSCADWFCI